MQEIELQTYLNKLITEEKDRYIFTVTEMLFQHISVLFYDYDLKV